MNKSLVILILICFPFLLVYSQEIDYNKIILPNELSDQLEITERLVQIAWNNHPSSKVLEHESNISDYEIRKARSNWLDNIRISGNLNEFTISPPEDQVLFIPRYNFSVSFTLYSLISSPADTKIAKEKKVISELNINQYKLQIRKEVLTRYQNFKMYENLFTIQNEITEGFYSKYLLAEQKFKDQEIPLEEYNLTLTEYNESLKAKIEAENAYLTSKYNLEELLGINIEDIE